MSLHRSPPSQTPSNFARSPTTASFLNPTPKSSIQLYHQVFRQRKYLMNSRDKLKNRLHLVSQIQNKIWRESNIKAKQQEYKMKYKSLYCRHPTTSDNDMGANIYRATESRKKVMEKQNSFGVEEMRKASELYRKTIENNKRMEKERKHNMVNKVKEQKMQMKKTLSEFKEFRANRVEQIIKSKIQNEKKRCEETSKSIDKLSRSCKNRDYIMESLEKPKAKAYLFTKIF